MPTYANFTKFYPYRRKESDRHVGAAVEHGGFEVVRGGFELGEVSFHSGWTFHRYRISDCHGLGWRSHGLTAWLVASAGSLGSHPYCPPGAV